MKKKGIIIGVIVFVIALVVTVFFLSLKSVSKDNKVITFTVKSGENKIQIVNNLKKAGLIRNKYATLAYVFLNPGLNLQAGTYSLSRSMSTQEIIDYFNSGKINDIAPVVHITFVEGKRLIDYLAQISDAFGFSEEEMISKLKDEEFLDSLINDYSILTDEIKNKDLYYSLEGYLYPDTYEFYQSSSFENVIRKMLTAMENKLNPYMDSIKKSGYSVHDILTMASIIEKEAVTSADRKIVSQVIYKRLDLNMSLGMDVTSYYGANLSMKEEITFKELNDDNPYNTRLSTFLGLPVGPICSPSIDSITAALNPSDTNYVYFYADIKTGKVYFAEDAQGFYDIQKKLGDK